MTEKDKISVTKTDENDTEPDVLDDTADDAPPANDSTSDDTIKKDMSDDGKEAVAAAEQATKEAYEKYLRVSAEFDNYKKRMTRETDEFKKYANEALISALLPVIDNLERAILSAREDAGSNESLIQGVELTLNEILKVLAKYRVDAIESLGKPFDPNFHQAMLQEETDEHPDNTIIQEMQKGYTIHNRLLRPAMVVVSKTKN